MNDSMSVTDKWLYRPEKKNKPSLRLFCFPYGGGGASFYRKWAEDLPSQIELCAVQLPGRESRLREEPFTRLIPLVETLARIVEQYSDTPFALFGHSMGSWIAFELARLLRRKKENFLLHVFVSGRRAPHTPKNDYIKHNLPKEEFIASVRGYNGTPELIFKEPELLDLFLPILRADFAIMETYQYIDDDPLECPITAFGGLQDEKTGPFELEAWSVHTSNKFRKRVFPGNHFYLKDVRHQLIGEILKDLTNYL